MNKKEETFSEESKLMVQEKPKEIDKKKKKKDEPLLDYDNK